MADGNKQLPFRTIKFDCPKLEDIKYVLQEGLQRDFVDVSVSIVDCPNLTKEPFNLASSGIGGNTSLIDIGGPPFLLPCYNASKIYNMKEIACIIGMKSCFLIGAGAGPWPYVGKNCEMIANTLIDNPIIQKTYIAKLNDKNDKPLLEMLPSCELRFALLANLYASEGKPSKVLKVICKKRKGSDNFITAMRLALDRGFPNKTIGLGGTFLLKEGIAKQHIMPDFSKVPINSDEELNKWLKFFDMPAPLVAVGTLISKEVPGFDLRVQHFHSFSDHGLGGHYHYDITPDTVEYIGYFNLAQTLYRIDQPPQSENYGKD